MDKCEHYFGWRGDGKKCLLCGHIKGSRPSRSVAARFMRGESIFFIAATTGMDRMKVENKIRRHKANGKKA